MTYKLHVFIKLRPSFTNLLTFRQPLLHSSERSLFAAVCRHGEQLVTDMRKLVLLGSCSVFLSWLVARRWSD